MTSDHHDRDGIPLPTGPLEDAAGGEVVTLRAGAGRARRPVGAVATACRSRARAAAP